MNLEGDLGEASADNAWSSGIRWWCFLAGAGFRDDGCFWRGCSSRSLRL
jgi:hypothetical protein